MRWLAAIAVFAALVVSACSGPTGEGGSTPTPTASTAPRTSTAAPSTPSTSPTTPTVPADVPTTGPNVRGPGEKPPVEPIAATQHTPAGAKVFAEFFIKTIDWGFATMSGAYIRHYSTAGCASCTTLAQGIDKDRLQGDRYVGGRMTVGSGNAMPHPVVNRAAFTIKVPIAVQSFEQFDRTGKPVTATPAHGSESFEVSLEWTGRAWQTIKLGLNT